MIKFKKPLDFPGLDGIGLYFTAEVPIVSDAIFQLYKCSSFFTNGN